MDEESQLRRLLETVPQHGVLTWIGLRPKKRAALESVDRVDVDKTGLVGDRYAKAGGKRAVSMIQSEHLPVITALSGTEATPALLRRNLVIEGIPVAALRRLRFSIGEVLFEGADRCAPCTRMEEALGAGGYAAMLDMGGIVARVIEPGTIRVGDTIRAHGISERLRGPIAE